MKIHASKPLFAWDCLESSPTLGQLREFLESLPDGPLLEALERHRAKGRNDYPVTVCWGICMLRIACRQATMDGMLQELHRNPVLAYMIGIESEKQIPDKHNMSRFEEVLGLPEHVGLLHGMFNAMVARLAGAVPDLGAQLAGDASALHARPARKAHGDHPDLPTPAAGKKEYLDAGGQVTETYEWFGYKFHLVVDTKHEVAVGYQITSANVDDGKALPDVLDDARENLGDATLDAAGEDSTPRRIRSLAYDKACDRNEVHDLLARHGIAGIIETRALWKENPERMLPGDDGNENIVYDEEGTLYCYDKVSDPPVRHKMTYFGYEKDRDTLKYRCPARHNGWTCPSDDRCNRGKTYGKTKRVACEIEPRRFCRVPRGTKKFQRLYKGRTAVERVNSRLKVFWGMDDGNVTGNQRFAAKFATVMLTHITFATMLARAERWEGTLSQTRLSPIAKALQ